MTCHFLRRTPVSCLILAIVMFGPAGYLIESADAQEKLTKGDIERLVGELSNWGRWGSDDQIGTLNLITPAKRKQAAGLVQEGISVSLARDAEKEVAKDNPKAFGHEMLSVGKDSTGMWSGDKYSVAYHGFAHTHMDSLCHLFHNDKMYNGFSRDEVTQSGALKLHIGNVKSGIFTRGILIDIPELKGVEFLQPGTPIYPSDLEAWESRTGVKVGSGDVVFIRTGRWRLREVTGPWSVNEKGVAGLHASCAKWLRKRDVAMLGSDGAADVMPSGVEGVKQPIHLLVLHAIGIHIFDNCDLEAISRKAKELERWEFALTAAPLPVQGGTGSPLNPIATF